MRKIWPLALALELIILGLLPVSARSFSLPFFNTVAGTTDSVDAVSKIDKTLRVIQRHYYDPKRINIDDMLESGMRAITQKLPNVLVAVSKKDKQLRVELDSQSHVYSYAEAHTVLDIAPLFATVFKLIDKNDLAAREHLKRDDIEYAVCDAFLSTLDPHSSVLTPDVLQDFKAQTEGEFGGVGIVIGMKDNLLTVIAPLSGTPASRAKIQSGDHILKIDTEPSLNMPLSEAVEKLRGKVGTTVKIVIEREGVGEIPITLKREIIRIESIQSALLTDLGKHIGYIKIKSFQGDTYSELLKHLEHLKSKTATSSLDGLILDMRNNPGGLLDQAIGVSDLFLNQGPIVMTVGTGGTIEDIRMAKGPGTEPTYPMVVLVNGGSASASEIVAAALKDNGRALVMGDQTFGKGSVQSVFNLESDSAVKMTIAEYWTAARRSIQTLGVTPDVALFPRKVSQQRMDLIPNVRFTELDLEKHLENTKVELQKPKYKLSYFDTAFFKESLKKKPDATDAEDQQNLAKQAKEYAEEADVSDDPWVLFAKGVLGLYQTTSNFNLDNVLTPWIAAQQKKEDQALTTALLKLTINWAKPAGSAGTGPIALETTLKQDGKAVTALSAGKEGTIEVKATNRGTQPVYQLVAVTRTPKQHFIFDDREFVFGEIAPGATATASTVVKLPSNAPTFTEPVTYDLYSGLEKKIGEGPSRISVTELNKPRVSFSYTLTDTAADSKTAKPGNDAVDPGELIQLTLNLKNESATAADSVQLNLKNESGKNLTLETGRQDVGTLKPQEQRKTTLSFRVDPNTTEKTLSLELFVSANKSDAILNSRLTFPLASKTGMIPPPKMEHQPPLLTVSKITPLATSKDNKTTDFIVAGTVSDLEGVKDLQAFVGEDKQCLKVAPKNTKKMDFSCTLHSDPSKKERFFFLLGRNQDGIMERGIYGIPLQ